MNNDEMKAKFEDTLRLTREAKHVLCESDNVKALGRVKKLVVEIEDGIDDLYKREFGADDANISQL